MAVVVLFRRDRGHAEEISKLRAEITEIRVQQATDKLARLTGAPEPPPDGDGSPPERRRGWRVIDGGSAVLSATGAAMAAASTVAWEQARFHPVAAFSTLSATAGLATVTLLHGFDVLPITRLDTGRELAAPTTSPAEQAEPTAEPSPAAPEPAEPSPLPSVSVQPSPLPTEPEPATPSPSPVPPQDSDPEVVTLPERLRTPTPTAPPDADDPTQPTLPPNDDDPATPNPQPPESSVGGPQRPVPEPDSPGGPFGECWEAGPFTVSLNTTRLPPTRAGGSLHSIYEPPMIWS